MTEVIPAIIPEDFQLMRSEMSQVKELVNLVQIDIIDGRFAPEATWPYAGSPERAIFDEILDGKRGWPFWKNLQFEIDLMVERPEDVLDGWIKSGASAIIIHASSTDKHAEIFDRLAERGVGIGLALKPSDANAIVKKFREQIDFLQLMGSDEIGYHGVELDPLVYEKIADIRAGFPHLPIGVDIGVNFKTAPELVRAGATRLVSGSTIFGAKDMSEAIEQLKASGSAAD